MFGESSSTDGRSGTVDCLNTPRSLRSAALMIPASTDDMLHIDDAQVHSDPMSGAGCDKQLPNMRLPILNLQSALDKEYLQHRMHQRSKDADPVSSGLSQ